MKKLMALGVILLGLMVVSASAFAANGEKSSSAKSSASTTEEQKVHVKIVPREKRSLSEILKDRRLIKQDIPVLTIQDKQAMQVPSSYQSIEIDYEDFHKYI